MPTPAPVLLIFPFIFGFKQSDNDVINCSYLCIVLWICWVVSRLVVCELMSYHLESSGKLPFNIASVSFSHSYLHSYFSHALFCCFHSFLSLKSSPNTIFWIIFKFINSIFCFNFKIKSIYFLKKIILCSLSF